jgi:hypothetical protein
MKFQFITSVAAVLLSSGHGVFAAEEVRCCCWSSQSSDIPDGGGALLLLLLLLVSMCCTCSSVCLSAFDVEFMFMLLLTHPYHPSPSFIFYHLSSHQHLPQSVPQNCQKEDNRSACARRLPCVWVEMEGGGGSWATQSCCETTDVKCILGYYLADAIPTPPAPAPAPAPPAPRPRRSHCVKLGEEAADWAQTTMCQQVVSFPWKDNSQLMDCRGIATQTCKNILADRVMQSCGLNTDRQEVRRACKSAVNDLLGSAAVTEEDYEVEPYEEEKFDYSYLSEDNKLDPYGEDFDSSTSEDVEMESYDEDIYAYNNRANKNRRQGYKNKMRRQGANKMRRQGGYMNKMRRQGGNKMRRQGGYMNKMRRQGGNKKLPGNTKKGTITKFYYYCFPTISLNTHSPIFCSPQCTILEEMQSTLQ